MEVYVALWSFDYEGDSLEGVFSTKEKAEKFLSEHDCAGFIGSPKLVKITIDKPDSAEEE